MIKDPRVYLQHIFECAELVENYSKNINESEFDTNIQLQDAICRRLEIIGEATKRLSEKFRKKYPNVPWKQMAGLRDVLIHRYEEMDLENIWKIVKKDVPEVKKLIQKIIAELKEK